MVLEALYPVKYIEKHVGYAFILGLAYTVIAIGAAVILFPEDPAIVAVAFTAIMIYPTIKQLLKQEEEEELMRESRTVLGFFVHHWSVFEVYIMLFLGMIFAFSFFALVLPSLASNYIFANQLAIMFGGKTGAAVTGHAVFSQALFNSIFSNNLMVMALILVTGVLFGDGAIFLIAWNASVWGTIFGNTAKAAAVSVGNNPYIYFSLVFLSVLPHMLLEAIAYFIAASVAGISSHTLVRKNIGKENLKHTFKNLFFITLIAVLILAFASAIEVYALKNFGVYRAIITQAFQSLF